MAQKVSRRELAAVRALDEQRAGTAGAVQCDGCPAGVLVQTGRSGHLDSCDLCSRHCSCLRVPDGIGGEDQ